MRHHASIKMSDGRMKSVMKTIALSIFAFWAVSALKALGQLTPAPAENGSNKIGQVYFQVSAGKATQEQFDRGIALLHSFWYDKADRAFLAAVADDPACSMANWGLAMSLYHPLWDRPDDATLRKGRAYIQQAKAAMPKTQREQDYIEAIEVFYKDSDKIAHQTRAEAYAKAMERLSQRYPEDREAAIFFALSLLGSAPPFDKTYANQKKAAGILEKISLEMPDHPGVIHYIIHAYDSPALASLGLSAARKYAKVAPAIPHAQHMPSHIFCRLGFWQESIQSNLGSLDATRKAATGSPNDRLGELHSLQFLAYSYLQGCQDGKAREIVGQLDQIRKSSGGSSVYFNWTPALVALERRDWAQAAALSPVKGPQAGTYFARAVGAARSGDLASARKDLEKLDGLKMRLMESDDPVKAGGVDLLCRKAAAWMAHAEGNHEEAATLMRAAAELEEAILEEIPLLPARELLGELLAESNEPRRALAEFAIALRDRPNRFTALYGAGDAARKSGDNAKARTYFAKLAEVCADSDARRPELVNALGFLEGKNRP